MTLSRWMWTSGSWRNATGEKNTFDLSEHRGHSASGMHMATRIPNQTSLTHCWKTFAHGWLRWVGTPKTCTDKQGILDQAEGQGISVDCSCWSSPAHGANRYLPRQWVLGSSLRVHEDNSDLPLLEPEGRFRKQAQKRHKMTDCSGWGGSEHEDQKEPDWKVQANERWLGSFRCSVLLESRSMSPSVARTL